jgi:hypothetical protein
MTQEEIRIAVLKEKTLQNLAHAELKGIKSGLLDGTLVREESYLLALGRRLSSARSRLTGLANKLSKAVAESSNAPRIELVLRQYVENEVLAHLTDISLKETLDDTVINEEPEQEESEDNEQEQDSVLPEDEA